MLTKTDIAKMTVRQLVGWTVTGQIEQAIETHTEIDPDGIPVKAGSFVVGQVAAMKAEPYTNKLVDEVIKRYQSWSSKKTETE